MRAPGLQSEAQYRSRWLCDSARHFSAGTTELMAIDHPTPNPSPFTGRDQNN